MRKLFAFSAVTVAVGAALYAGIGYWAVPHYSRQILEETVAQKLGRTVTLDAVDFNPWTWVYEIRGLTIASRRGRRPFLNWGSCASTRAPRRSRRWRRSSRNSRSTASRSPRR